MFEKPCVHKPSSLFLQHSYYLTWPQKQMAPA